MGQILSGCGYCSKRLADGSVNRRSINNIDTLLAGGMSHPLRNIVAQALWL
jgi:hypothetical protein